MTFFNKTDILDFHQNYFDANSQITRAVELSQYFKTENLLKNCSPRQFETAERGLEPCWDRKSSSVGQLRTLANRKDKLTCGGGGVHGSTHTSESMRVKRGSDMVPVANRQLIVRVFLEVQWCNIIFRQNAGVVIKLWLFIMINSLDKYCGDSNLKLNCKISKMVFREGLNLARVPNGVTEEND